MLARYSVAAVLALAAGTPAVAAWPEKPIALIVPYAPGGLTDSVTRVLAEGLTRELKQPVVIENRPGAGGKIGMEQIKRAPADGYVIGLAVAGTMVTLPLTDPNYGLDPLKDFEPITLAVNTFNVLAVAPSTLPSGGLKEFIALAKSKPGQLNYGTPGVGTSFHFNNVLMAQLLGIDTMHVAYKGESNALIDVAGGAIDYMLAGQGAKSYADSGKVRPIAVTSNHRVQAYPDVPTFKELGIDFTTSGWVGYIAPAGVPPAVLDQLNAAFVKVIKDPKSQAAFEAMGYEPAGSTRAEFRKLIEDDLARYGSLITSGAVKLQ